MSELNSSAASINVGGRVRALREESGMSLRALAKSSEMSPNALSQIERGNASPSVSTLNRLAAALGVPITAFFDTGTPREAVVFVKAERRTRIPFS
ncbi:MAG: helix-turn-helix transcriptional regulator, partial [Chloroflexi bacterium]|nr:helix-turn-helix transcriptional regulator [Chloroflexota bacterium]